MLNYTTFVFHQLLNSRTISTSNHTGRNWSRWAKNYKFQIQDHHLTLMQPWDAFAILVFPQLKSVCILLYLKINFLIMSAQLINVSFKFNFINLISRGSVNIRSLALQILSQVTKVLLQRSVFTSCYEYCSIKVIIDVWTGTESLHVFNPSIHHTLPAVVFYEVSRCLSFFTPPVRRRPCVLCGPSVRHSKCAISWVCSMLSRMQTDRQMEKATSLQRSPAVMVRPACQGLVLSAKHNVSFVRSNTHR